MENIARDHIKFAKYLALCGCYSKAMEHYIAAFNSCPHLKTDFESEFTFVMMRLNEILNIDKKIDIIFLNFRQAIDTFPDNIYLLNEMGKYLYQYGFYTESWAYFNKALRLDPGYVNAEKNINSIKNLMVERWHFRMLNDKIRNEAYRKAIHETVTPFRDSVFDVGTGTGLLALYASECSPRSILACDGSEVMAKLAESITQENVKQEVTIINKMSTEMQFRDIGSKPTVVVTETFDAGLFGENVLEMLSHAWENLLNHNTKVIPCRAEFFIIGAKCDSLSMKYRLKTCAKNILGIPQLNVHVSTYREESYDCEDVNFYEDIKYLTEAKVVFGVDFNNYLEIQDKLHKITPSKIELKAEESDEMNIVVGWFNLHLAQSIVLTTNPMSKQKASAWQQAVFFDRIPESVTTNQIIEMEFVLNKVSTFTYII